MRSRLVHCAILWICAAGQLAGPLSASAQDGLEMDGQKRPKGEKTGFFDNTMKSDGMVEGMDMGLPKRNSNGYGDGTTNPSVGPLFNGVDGLDGLSGKKAPPTALVPEIETSNNYSVPAKKPKPVQTPTLAPTATPSPLQEEAPGAQNQPPSPEYLRQLTEQVKDPKKVLRPRPPPAASEQIPTPKPQSYTF